MELDVNFVNLTLLATNRLMDLDKVVGPVGFGHKTDES